MRVGFQKYRQPCVALWLPHFENVFFLPVLSVVMPYYLEMWILCRTARISITTTCRRRNKTLDIQDTPRLPHYLNPFTSFAIEEILKIE